jgi:hypothetical protein
MRRAVDVDSVMRSAGAVAARHLFVNSRSVTAAR